MEQEPLWDRHLGPLVIKIKCITVNGAVDIIKCALKDPCFRTTPWGGRLVDEMSLAAAIEAALIQDIPSIQVEAKEGEVFIYLKRALCEDEELMSRIRRRAAIVAGFDVKINCLMRP